MNRRITGKILKINPKYAKVDCGKRGLFGIPYSLLKIETETSNYIQAEKITLLKNTIENLEELMEDVKTEYQEVFQALFSLEEKVKLKEVTINWNHRQTFRLAGKYNRKSNRIEISISLKESLPKVVKKVIYHELLHIHFHSHGRIFRSYEHRFKDYAFCKKYIDDLFKQIMKGE
jgi:predicted SprT family Zn-dependent metalloprotease